MNQILRSASTASVAVFLFSGPCWAQGEAAALWRQGIAGGKDVAVLAAAWRPQGLKFLPVISNYLDLSQLERKLNELESKIKMDLSFTKNTSGTGFYCNEKNPPAVNSLLIGGNAEQAGLNLGDEIVKVNGQNVTSYQQIDAVTEDVLQLTLATEKTVTVRKQALPTMSLELLMQLAEESQKCRRTLNELRRQAAAASADPRAIAALAGQSRTLDTRITQLGDVLREELQRYLGTYRSAAS